MKRKIKITICTLVIILLLVEIIVSISDSRNKKNNQNQENSSTNTDTIINSINGIDDIYNSEIAKKYTDIRKLPKDYTITQAQKDNCFVIGAMLHNDNLYNEFMTNFNNKKSSFIRVVQTNNEGYLSIIDLLYDANSDKIYLVEDDTRDESLVQKERTIKYSTYEKTEVLNYQSSQYWIAYNGELPDEIKNGNSTNNNVLFIIATIN